MASNRVFPSGAFNWQLGATPGTVLNLGASPAMVKRLLGAGHFVAAVDPDHAALAKLQSRFYQAWEDGRLITMAGSIGNLPLLPKSCDTVVINKSLNAKVDLHQACTQLANILTDTGWVTGNNISRDNTVPWVRRLTELLRSVDETAMTGDFTNENHQRLLENKYFPRNELHDFRLWIPIGRVEMIKMVEEQKTVRQLPADEREQILEQAAKIYDDAAIGSDLRLPFILNCWRAYVDRAEITIPVSLDTESPWFSLK